MFQFPPLFPNVKESPWKKERHFPWFVFPTYLSQGRFATAVFQKKKESSITSSYSSDKSRKSFDFLASRSRVRSWNVYLCCWCFCCGSNCFSALGGTSNKKNTQTITYHNFLSFLNLSHLLFLVCYICADILNSVSRRVSHTVLRLMTPTWQIGSSHLKCLTSNKFFRHIPFF